MLLKTKLMQIDLQPYYRYKSECFKSMPYLLYYSLPCNGCYFHSLIFSLIIFTNIKKASLYFHCYCAIKKFIKECFTSSKHKKREKEKSWIQRQVMNFIGFSKKYFLKERRLSSCFKWPDKISRIFPVYLLKYPGSRLW